MLYFSNKEIYYFTDNQLTNISCQAVVQYKKNLKEIKQRNEWKTTGTGAQFMGRTRFHDTNDLTHVYPSDVVFIDQNKMIYAARLETDRDIFKVVA